MKLWGAVFAQACKEYAEDYRKYAKARKADPAVTTEGYSNIRWVESEKQGTGTFTWLCEVFDLDPPRARTALRMSVRKLLAS